MLRLYNLQKSTTKKTLGIEWTVGIRQMRELKRERAILWCFALAMPFVVSGKDCVVHRTSKHLSLFPLFLNERMSPRLVTVAVFSCLTSGGQVQKMKTKKKRLKLNTTR